MNAEIIAVGSELLLGQILNSNAQFISRQLAEIGLNVHYHTVVGDNAHRIKLALKNAEKRANFIILTGGLGPTNDDLTKDIVCAHLGRELVIDQASLDKINSFFIETNREMTKNNRKQALIIKDSIILKNQAGMAPGMFIKEKDHYYLLLPGPPSELQAMFKDSARGLILGEQIKKEAIVSRVLRFFDIGEALLDDKLADLLANQTNPTLAPLASEGEVSLRLTAKHDNALEANLLLNELEKEILKRVGDYCYGKGETTIIEELIKELKKQELSLASAESLTGGFFQKEITARPEISSIFQGGVVTYSNESKEKLLNISPDLIEKYGVVSRECAEKMAENVRIVLNTDIGISFTGVAGPGPLEGHPVGTVFIGIAFKGQATVVKKLNLGSARSFNRTRSVTYGAYYLLKLLRGK